MSKLFNSLKKDHRTVEGLFKQIEKASEKKRTRLFEELKTELIAHSKGEEGALYPAIQENEKTEDLARESVEEHHVVDLLLEELTDLSSDDEQWMAKLTVLKEVVQHHVEEEEKEMFKKAGKILDKDRQEEIAERIEEIKAGLKKGSRQMSRAA